MGKMRRRKNRAVLITHRFSCDKEPEKHYHSELMPFTPWRDEEEDLLHGFDTYAKAHDAVSEQINQLRKDLYHDVGTVSHAIDEYFEHGPPVSSWDDMASHQQQENLASVLEGAVPETFVDPDEDPLLTMTFVESVTTDAQAAGLQTENVPLLPDQEFFSLTQSLNRGQQAVFQYILDWCRAKRLCDKTHPFHIFCTGGAGVGKSHLIHAVMQIANRELRKAGGSPDDIIVHLTAPTDTAAYNIGGYTIHSSFLLTASASSKFDSISRRELSRA